MRLKFYLVYVNLLTIPFLSGCNLILPKDEGALNPTATFARVVAFQTATPEPTTPPPTSLPRVTSPADSETIPAPLPDESLIGGPALIRALQQGGYVIFFRHGATYRSQLDTDQQNLEICATQRNLNEAGQAQAEAIGTAFQTGQIPVGAVLASPYCRTRQTAELAFGRVELSEELINPFSKEDEAEVSRLGEQLRRLLSVPPPAGQNTILVGHTPNLQAATDLSIVEGEAAVFAPDGAGGFSLIGRVLPDQWGAWIARK